MPKLLCTARSVGVICRTSYLSLNLISFVSAEVSAGLGPLLVSQVQLVPTRTTITLRRVFVAVGVLTS